MRWYSLWVLVELLILKHQFGFSSTLPFARFLRHFDVFIRKRPLCRDEILGTQWLMLIWDDDWDCCALEWLVDWGHRAVATSSVAASISPIVELGIVAMDDVEELELGRDLLFLELQDTRFLLFRGLSEWLILYSKRLLLYKGLHSLGLEPISYRLLIDDSPFARDQLHIAVKNILCKLLIWLIVFELSHGLLDITISSCYNILVEYILEVLWVGIVLRTHHLLRKRNIL